MMGLVALVTHRNLRISGRDAAVLGLLAVMYAATSLGLLRSYDYIPSGVATTVNFLYPLVVAIVMALFFRERSSVWIVVAIFISLVGVALLAWGDAGHRDPARGLAFAGMTVVTYAVYIIGVMKSRTAMLDPLVVAFYVLTFSAAIFLVYALSTSGLGVCPHVADVAQPAVIGAPAHGAVELHPRAGHPAHRAHDDLDPRVYGAADGRAGRGGALRRAVRPRRRGGADPRDHGRDHRHSTNAPYAARTSG